MYKALVVSFPNVPLALAPELIDGIQRELKPQFVAEGLMLGEFHLLNNTGGLHNPHFYPLRTPFPSLAIRYMAPSDIVFLAASSYDSSTTKSLLESYMKRFGDRNSKEVQVALDAINKLAR